MVTSPCELRPPVRFLVSVSDFSGVCLVISLLSSIVKKRRAGVYGLNVFSAIFASYRLQILRVLDHFFAFGEPDVSLLPVGPKAFGTAAATQLAVVDRRANVIDLHFKNPLYRFLDFSLRRLAIDFEDDR